METSSSPLEAVLVTEQVEVKMMAAIVFLPRPSAVYISTWNERKKAQFGGGMSTIIDGTREINDWGRAGASRDH